MAVPAKLLLSSFGLLPAKQYVISELIFVNHQMTENKLSVQRGNLNSGLLSIYSILQSHFLIYSVCIKVPFQVH